MKNYCYTLSKSPDGICKLMRILRLTLFFLFPVLVANAQLVNVPVSGFNNDIVANETGPGTPGSMPGVTYPLIGVDGNLPTAFSFIDNTFLWQSGNLLPGCSMPATNTVASALTPGMTYQLQGYGTSSTLSNNALTLDNNSTSYTTSPFPNSGTLTLATPASYRTLSVLYETVVNVSPLNIDVTITFTDASTQVINGNPCVNWFTFSNVAFSGISRAGNQSPGTPSSCTGGPYLFEMQLPLNSNNFTKLVQSITFTIPTTFSTGTNSASVNYFHALAVGGLIGCTAPLSGNYTINNFQVTGGTNFSSFSDFASALACAGVSGPVVANVDLSSGTYDEQVNFFQVPGASATNTITINGNGKRITKTLLGNTSNYCTFNLNGADYFTVNNLQIDALGPVYGFGLHLMNGANFNTFSNCTINTSANNTNSTSIGVSISGSATSYSTSGINGSNNLFTGCTVNGGYMGFVFYGDGSTYLNNANNSIVNCLVQDFYFYGSYNYYQGNSTISGSIFQRPTRTALTSGYGIMLSTGCQNILIEKNRIRKMLEGGITTTNTTYGIYVSTTASLGLENRVINNLISDINSNGAIYAIYLSGAVGVKVYHNTIALTQASASGSSANTYCIYAPGAVADIRNNNIHFNRGGNAAQYGLYYSTIPNISNNNNVSTDNNYIFVSSAGATSSGTTVTVANTAGLYPGMKVYASAGAGVFAAGTTVTGITDATHFVVSVAPTTALSGATTVVTGFANDASYSSAAGATSASTTLTVASTVGLASGMMVFVTGGTGTFAQGTTVSSVTNGTTFTVSTAPTVALSGGASIVSAFWNFPTYTSAVGATNAGTTITVASTAGMNTGMQVAVTAGNGAFAPGTTVSSINLNGTQFVVSSAPTVALSGGAVITATSSSRYFGYNGSNIALFSSWKIANPTIDQQGVSVNPQFVSPSTDDYTPTNKNMNSIGANVGVSTDLTGASRSLAAPDPGAYEFTPAGLDASIQWASPNPPVTAGIKTISVLVANTMTAPITDLSLTYSDGTTSVTQVFSGLNIGAGGSQLLTFTTPYNLFTSANLTAVINLVNGVIDNSSANNSTGVNLCLSLAGGTYTIDATLPPSATNFQSFNALLALLNCGGIIGPVIVNVAPGNYSEQVEFKQVSGASSTNTITINGNNTTYTSAPGATSTSTTYASAAGATSAGTTITVGSTTNLSVGMFVSVTAGAGTFATNTTVSSITDATHFEVSATPTVALSGGASVVSGSTGTITVASSAGLSVGMTVAVIGGTGLFTGSTRVTSITDATHFVVSQAPTTALSGTTTIVTGNTTTLTFAATVSAAPGTLVLNGTDWLTVNNLNVVGTSSSLALTCHLYNQADNNTFSGCIFTCAPNVTSSQAAFSLSCSANSATTTGSLSGNNNVITGCTMNSGVYCLTLCGNSTASPNTGTQVINCTLRDQYNYGIYNVYSNGTILSGNILERTNRTSLSTYYGIYMSTGCSNFLVEKNKIRKTWETAPTTTGTQYCFYYGANPGAGNENKFYNNLVSDINFNGTIYGFYNFASDVKFYHNTLSFDQTTASGSTSTYGIYNSASNSDYRNNIISIRRGGTGVKTCYYYSTVPTASNYNDVFIVAGATNYIEYNGTTGLSTLAAWQAVNPSLDQQTKSANPVFVGSGDYTPGAGSINNMCLNLGVASDISGSPRGANPDPGAYEFVPIGLDAIINWVSPAVPPFPAGANTITVGITNNGITTITSLNLRYTDGTTTVNELFSGLNITVGGNQNITFTTPYNLAGSVTITASIQLVNGLSDADPTNNTASQIICIPLTGTYTINSALATGGTNFQTFTAAVNQLASCGISGPVIFNVSGGPFTEQIEIPVIGGASSVNTITVNGTLPAGSTLQFTAGTTSYPTLRLNGADYMTWNNMNFVGLSTAQGFAGQLSNSSDNNTFNYCNFSVPTTVTSSTLSAFNLSALNTSPTAGGNNGSNNTFNNCKFTGGYYCVAVYGNTASSSAPTNNANKFFGCTFSEYYYYGLYHGYSNNAVVSGCTVERPTRAAVSGTYGMYFFGYGGVSNNNLLVEKNRIRNLYGGNPVNTGFAYGIYISSDAAAGSECKVYNNVITDIAPNSSTSSFIGIYCFGSYTNILHNTVSFNYGAFAGTGGTFYGIYSGASSNVKVLNNIVSITVSGPATGTAPAKYCLYYSPQAAVLSDNNDLYMNSTNGVNMVAWDGTTTYPTLAAWQAAYPTKDQQSISLNPQFTNPSGNDYSPGNYNLDNTALPANISSDVNGNLRSLSAPDIGAYEVTMAPTADFTPVSLVSPGTDGCYSNTQALVVRIKNKGNYTHNFSTTPVTITCNVTGTATATLTGIPTGTLASQQTMDVTLSGTVDMSAVGTYNFAISSAVTGDVNAANDNMPAVSRLRIVLAAGTLSTDRDKVCGTTPSLTLTGKAGGSVQWKESTSSASGPWTNVGTNSISYSPPAAPGQTTYYMADVSCYSDVLSTNVQTVQYNIPSLASKTGAARCGIGEVVLNATTDALSVANWYTSRDGGSPVFTGNNYTIPALSGTTKYYMTAAFGGYKTKAGLTAPPSYYSYTTSLNYGIQFDALQPFKITTVDVYPAATANGTPGTITIGLQNSSGVTLQQKTVNVIGYLTPLSFAAKNVIDLGFNVPQGTGYRLVLLGYTNIFGLQYDCGVSGNCSTPFYTSTYNNTVPGTLALTAAYTSGTLYNYYWWYFYNMGIATGSGCESSRDSVTATYTPAPAISATVSNAVVCPGTSTQLSLLTTANPAYTYTWTPGNITGTTASVSPTAYTNYTLTGVDNTAGPYAGCQFAANIPVSTYPKVSVIATGNPVSICSGEGTQLGVSASTSVAYAMHATTPSPVPTPASGVTTLNNSNFPGNTGGLDDGYFTVDLPFDFSYFGSSHNRLYINTNGYVSFANGYTGVPSNQMVILPHTGDMNNAIYLAWKDQDLSISGSIKYFTVGTAPRRTFVIRYENVPPYVVTPPATGNKLTGQIELYEDDSRIELFLAQTDAVSLKTLGLENPLGIGAYAPSPRNGEAWTVVSPEQWEFLPIGGSLAYSWTPSAHLDNPTSTTPFASFIFESTNFTATVADANGGCTGTGSVNIATGDPFSAPINADYSVICAGESSILTIAPSGGCSPYSYKWSDGTSQISTVPFISVTPTATTTYTCTVTDGTTTEYPQFKTITVNPLPTVSSTNALICGSGTATLSATGNAVSYTWSPSMYLNTTTGTSVTSTALSTITYTVTATSALGCTKKSYSTVTKSIVTTVTTSASMTALPINGTTTLNAVGSLIPKESYTVSAIPYSQMNQTVLTGPGPTGDEGNANAALGFAFNYFGTNYTDVTIHSNGQILFGANRTEANTLYYPTPSHNTLPSAAQPNNWVGFWGDMSPAGGQVTWGVVGSAPARKLIVRFTNASWFSTGPSPLSYQVELNETSNSIDLFLTGMSGGTNATSHSRLMGLENADGTLGTIIPGHTPVEGYWTAGNEGWHIAKFDTTMIYAWSPATFLDDDSIYSPVASNMTASTTYTVTATNIDGCQGTSSIPIQVGIPLTVTASTSANNFCELLKDTLRAAPSGGCQPYVYSWSDGTNVLDSTTKNVQVSPPSGVTTYTLTVTDDCQGTATTTVTVTVKPAPTMTVTKSSDICGNSPSTLTAAGSSLSYAWSPATSLSATTGAVITTTATSTIKYKVIGTAANGCARPDSITINVFPAVFVNPTATPSAVCVNGTSVLAANAATDNGYTVSSIPFSARDASSVLAGSGAALGDEGNIDVPLGFSFNFYGNVYTGVTIHSNGQILMGLTNNTANTVYSPPASGIPNAAAPNNWCGYWVDQNVTSAGSITYDVVGTAPNRKLIVRVDHVNYYSATPSNTFQTELNETSNIVDFFMTDNTTTSTLYRQIGMENATGLNGISPPGRNYGLWTTTLEGWRFTPIIPTLVYSWTPATYLDSTNINSPTASNIASTITYSATVTNSSTGCSGSNAVTVFAGEPLVATIAVKIPTTCSGDKDSLTATVTGGKAPYTYSWSNGTSVIGTSQKIMVSPLVTTQYTVTATDNCGNVIVSAPASINVIALPVLTVTPPGGSICNGVPSSISMTASGADTYSWSPAIGLNSITDATVIATSTATTTYTVTGVNTTTSCKNAKTVTIARTLFMSGSASASPSQLCASQPSQLNSSFAVKTNPALLITEVTQFAAGSIGATTPRPAYFNASDDDFIEISNLSNDPVSASGLSFELWVGASLNLAYTIPASAVIAGHSTLVIHIGTGADIPASNYYHTGSTPSDPLTSSNSYGYLLKSGGAILDAVATTNSSGISYPWPPASGVNATQWTGTIPFTSPASAGVIRTGGFDSNSAPDWEYASNITRQTLGAYSNYYGSNSQPAFTYAWSPSTYLSDATINNPVVSGSSGGTLNYTVTATDPVSGCTNSATTSILVTPLPTATISLTGTSNVCVGSNTTLSFAFTGVGPWVYSFTDGTTTFGPYTSNATTATHTVTPSGAAGDIVTYSALGVTDSRCDGLASSLSGSAVVTVRSSSTMAGITLTSNKAFNNICLGDNITISMNNVTPSSLGYNAHWKWYSSSCAGTPVAGSTDQLSITVNPTVSTTYFVRAEGYCGNTPCMSLPVVVTTTPPSGNPGLAYAPTIAFDGASDSIRVNAVPGATFYHWTTNGNSNILFDGHTAPYESSSPAVTLTFISPATNGNGIGNYHIQFFAGNACGTTNSNNIRIRATVEAPSAINGPLVACSSQTKLYTVTPVVGAKSYQWSFQSGGGSISGNGTLSVNVTFTSLPAVLCVHGVTANGSAGPDYCINISTITATPGPISGNLTPCQGGSAVYSIDSVVGAVSYAWSTDIPGATIIGTTNSVTANFPSNTFSGSICVTAYSGCGTSLASCLPIVSGTVAPLGTITGPIDGVCNANSINYQVPSTGATTYNWTVPSGASIQPSTQGTNSILVDFTNSYAGGNITVVSTNTCGIANGSLPVTGIPAPPNVTGSTEVCAGLTEGYTAESPGATSYSWNINPLEADTQTTSATGDLIIIDWLTDGGTVVAMATNACGTSQPGSLVVGAGACRLTGQTSFVELLNASLFPNPSQGRVTLQFNSPESSDYRLNVRDIAGREMLSERIVAMEGLNQHEINLGNAAKGVYLLSLENNSGDKMVIRLVVN